MKYLIKYKLFESESNDEIKETLEEILYDLNDMGINTEVRYATACDNRIYITIGDDNPKSPIIYIDFDKQGSELSETIQRIDDYMKSVGYVSHWYKIPKKDSNFYQCGYAKPEESKILESKLFESSEDCMEIKRTCEDILLDLKDEGFKTDVRMGLSPFKDEWDYPDFFNIKLTKIDQFTVSDIQEYLLRLSDYLKEFDMIVDSESYACHSLSNKDIKNHIIKQWGDPDYWQFEIFFRQQDL